MAKRKTLSPLQRAFDKSGLTFEEFAQKVGARTDDRRAPSASTAHGWVKGTHGIKPKWLRPIAEALDLEVTELLA